jgi:acetyltransferase-like isoleucine patch superfamily enzyme
MKTGLGLYRKYRTIYAYINLFRFWLRNKLLGLDVANQFIQSVDKISILLILRKNGATIGRNCDIETGLTLHNCKDYAHLIIGNNCHIGKNCFFDLRDKIESGNQVTISMGVSLLTHQDMGMSSLVKHYKKKHNPLKIEDNVYIGAKATILDGVTIHKNSIIAAGAVVLKDVKNNTLVGGVPAKIIKNK